MKSLLTTLLIILCFNGNAQQGNLCQLLIKCFNTSDAGFPYLRPGTSADTIKDYSINEDTVKNYGLKNGRILKYANIKSKLYDGKTYTAWTLLLSAPIRFLNGKKWDEVKETVASQLSNFTKQYADVCFSQLQMSELILPVEEYDNAYFTYYFYPKSINIPKGANKTQIESLLSEAVYIEFSVKKSALVSGYYMNYSVNGLKYDN